MKSKQSHTKIFHIWLYEENTKGVLVWAYTPPLMLQEVTLQCWETHVVRCPYTPLQFPPIFVLETDSTDEWGPSRKPIKHDKRDLMKNAAVNQTAGIRCQTPAWSYWLGEYDRKCVALIEIRGLFSSLPAVRGTGVAAASLRVLATKSHSIIGGKGCMIQRVSFCGTYEHKN